MATAPASAFTSVAAGTGIAITAITVKGNADF
jgi:hypothetical protein